MEDRQQREREKIKREIMLGADYLNQDDGFQIFVTKDVGCLTTLYNWVSNAIDCVIPLGSDLKYFRVVSTGAHSCRRDSTSQSAGSSPSPASSWASVSSP
ncbi:MAG: hypothetical protein P4M11_15380 [Candidatus Pacebacteria bacterium]|nr:hypothetical protein [Candidatus Paceibacterota bacterium]